MADYLGFANLVTSRPSIGESFLAGQQQAAQEQLLRQKQEQEMEMAQQRQKVMSDLMSNPNPTAKDILNASMYMDKDAAESLRKSFEVMGSEKQSSALNLAGQVMSAFEMGKPEVASDLLKSRAEAARNSGDEQNAKFYDVMAQNAIENPHAAKLTIGMMTAHMPGGDKVMEAVGKRGEELRKQELQPGEVKKQEGELRQQAAQLGLTKAQTNKAMVEATYLPKKLAADIGLTQAQTQQALMAARKSAIEMAAAPPDQQKMQASLSAQQALDQANTVLLHPGRSMGTGVTSFVGKIPGTEAKGFQANLETFKAQTFIPMVSTLKGMGALSDAEGKKLAASVGALDPDMPTDEFETSLKGTMDFLYKKAKAAGLDVNNPLEKREQAGGPPQGGSLQVVPPDIAALLAKHGAK